MHLLSNAVELILLLFYLFIGPKFISVCATDSIAASNYMSAIGPMRSIVRLFCDEKQAYSSY